MTKSTILIPELQIAVEQGVLSPTVGRILASLPAQSQQDLVVQRNGTLHGMGEREAKQIRREILNLPEEAGFEQRLGFDFKLQVANVWNFNRVPDVWRERLGDFKGGIHPHLVANLLYYFSEPGLPIVDPMAGSGVTGLVIDHYRYFNEATEAEGSGARPVWMYDLLPIRPDIGQRNILDGLPLADNIAGFTLLDPPYLNIPANYYGDHPALLSRLHEPAWFEAMAFIAGESWRITRPGGRVAVVSNDYLKGQAFIPIGYRLMPLFEQVGFESIALILDVHNNYVYNANAFIVANAKRFKYRLNALRQVSIFEKQI